MAYFLDANVFIKARQPHYAFDLCPSFSTWVGAAHSEGDTLTIDDVRDELKAGDGALCEWAQRRPSSFCAPIDAVLLQKLADIAQGASGQSYRSDAIARCQEDADHKLIAYAHAHGHTLVTREKLSNGVRQTKITDIAIGMNIPYTNTFEMLRRERARFVLGAGA